jgi:hypothetical protein
MSTNQRTRHLLLNASFLLFCCSLKAQAPFDTVLHRTVGPGVSRTTLIAPSVPWIVNVLEIDLTNPYLSVETVKAQDRLIGQEQTTSMAARKEAPGHRIVAAVNGDGYLSGGEPLSMQMIDGQLLKDHLPDSDPVIGFDRFGAPLMQMLSFDGEIRTSSSVIHFPRVNRARESDDLVLYNRYFGTSTGTSAAGAEFLLSPITEWYGNGLVRCVVDSVADAIGNLPIPTSKVVFSATGTKRTQMLGALSRGDTVDVFLGIFPGAVKIKELIGGFSILVSEGVTVTTKVTAREPRTSAGFSADSTKLYLWTVDGRFPGSAGMTYLEMADFMLSHNMAFGINLDGGGSTTMVVDGSIVNRPSDGSERPVANGILVVSSAPSGTLADVQLEPMSASIHAGDSLQFSVYATDEYGNPFTIDPSQLVYSVPLHLGVISESGMFRPANALDSGYVTVRTGSLSDSSFIRIVPLTHIGMSPRNVVTDTTRTVSFTVRGNYQDGSSRSISSALVAFSVLNPAVGTISAAGVFSGWTEGSTDLVADYLGMRDTVFVTVSIGLGTCVIDSIEAVDGFAVSTLNVDSAEISVVPSPATLGAAALRIRYSYLYYATQVPTVYVNTWRPVFGVPDTLILDVCADTWTYRIFYTLSDDNGEEFRVSSGTFADVPGLYERIPVSMSTVQPLTGGAFFYPVTITRIEIRISGSGRIGGNRYSGEVLIDNLRAHYPATVTSLSPSIAAPSAYELAANYPNPFNPTTTIVYSVPVRSRVRLDVYNVLGQRIATLVDEEQAASVSAVQWRPTGAGGLYFYRLEADALDGSGRRHLETRKMLYIR